MDTLIYVYDQSLIPGAQQAIKVCLDVQPEQRVFILTDRKTLPVGASIYDVAKDVAKSCKLMIIEDHVERPAQKLPDIIMNELDSCEVCLYCVNPMPNELGHRQQFVGYVESKGIRYAHMVGITEQIMCQGMRADFRKVDEVSKALIAKAKKAKSITVKSRRGTDMVATFSQERIWRKTSGIIEEVWSNLPGGEIFTAPISVDGVFVVDGSVGDHFSAKYGVLDKTPMTLHLEGGYLKKVECDNTKSLKKNSGNTVTRPSTRIALENSL